MTMTSNPCNQHLNPTVQKAVQDIWQIAQTNQDNSLALLAILRSLEALHHQIRDGLFQEALPTNRQSLYKLLRDIEANGGWPYIHRMRLTELIEQLEEAPEDSSEANPDVH
jgi:hypothetical protein